MNQQTKTTTGMPAAGQPSSATAQTMTRKTIWRHAGIAEHRRIVLARAGHLSIFAGMPKSDPVEPTDLNLIHYRELNIHGANSSALDAFDTRILAAALKFFLNR